MVGFASVYTRCYSRYVAKGDFLWRTVHTVIFESLVLVPLMYFPIYYTVEATIEKKPGIPLHHDAFMRFKRDIQNDMKKYWVFWVPVQSVNFAFVPSYSRGYFCAFVGSIWSAYLSLYKN